MKTSVIGVQDMLSVLSVLIRALWQVVARSPRSRAWSAHLEARFE